MDGERAGSIFVGVAGVVWNAAGQVLLIRRRNPPRAGQWSLPGGRLELGERLEDGVRREVREETGVEIEILGLCGVAEIPDAAALGRPGHFVLIDYSARAVGGTLAAGDDAAEAAWFAPERLPEGMWAETVRMIGESWRLHGGNLVPP